MLQYISTICIGATFKQKQKVICIAYILNINSKYALMKLNTIRL